MSIIRRPAMLAYLLPILMLAVVPPALATVFTWDGNGGDGSWSDANNWGGTGPVDGDELYFGSGFASGTTLNNDSLTSANSLIFLPPAGGLTLQGNDLTLTGGLTNQNATAGRVVTIENNLNISGAQIWAGSANANGVTLVNGDLTGTGNITLSTWNNSNVATLPALRLGGSNSGYTGTITTDGANSLGLLLLSPTAMTGGLIDLNGGNRNLWLTANSSSNPYVFGTGNTAGSPNVNFRNTGTAGLYLTGGDVYWDPGNGGDYTWAAGSHGQIRINGSNDSARRMLYWGNDTSSLILTGNRGIYSGGGGNNPGYITVRSAFADDATGGRVLTLNTTLAVLTRDAVNNGAAKSSTTVSGGALSISDMDQIFDGNLSLGGGVLVLDNVSWSDFTTDRSAGYGAGADQWQITAGGGGFAARGSAVTIDATGTSASTFDRSFTLGSGSRDGSGVYYANAGVTIACDTTLSALRAITVANNGVGYGVGIPVLNAISGNLSGPGALQVTGVANISNPGTLTLAGANTWSGGVSVQINGPYFNSGAGGMNVNKAFVQFDGDSSLPSGNGGAPAYLGAIDRNNGTPYGYLLTGNAAGQTYDLPANYRFMIGTMGTGDMAGILGADGGKATLANATVLIHDGDASTDAQSLNLLVRNGAQLTLGTSGNPVRFVPSTGRDVSASATATTALDATGNRSLIKRGEGTLVLGNVVYTDVAETGDTSAQFVAGGWQIGRGGVDNTPAAAYFDGAIRETGNTTANSLTGFNVRFQGGVLESSDTVIGGAFTRALGTGTTQVRWAQGGGGFAAYGGPLTVNIGGASSSFTWASSANFLTANNPLIFGSRTADDAVTFQNPISLNAGTRDIRVIDNPGSASDLAELAGGLAGTAAANNLLKTGDGVLRMSGPSVYGGATTVSAGTLLIGADDNAPAPLAVESVQLVAETITRTNHGFTVGQRIGLDATTMIGGTSRDIIYYVINPTPDTFQISLSDGGPAVDLTNGGSTRSVLQAGALGGRTATAVTLGDANTGNSPVALLTDGAFTVARSVIVANVNGAVTLGGNANANSTFSGNIALNKNVLLTSAAMGGNATTFSGVISNGVITGNAVTKVGAGVVSLDGANTYDGGTFVNSGTLIANNDIALGTGGAQVGGGTLQVAGGVTVGNAVTVNNGGTLSGSGAIGGAVTINNGGTLAPGSSPGTLTVNSLTLDSMTYLWELGSSAYDNVTVNGALTFNGAPQITFALRNLDAVDPTGQIYTLFTSTGISGGYTYAFDAESANHFNTAGATVTDDGSNVYLSGLTPVPEPATLALLGLGGALAAWRRRKQA